MIYQVLRTCFWVLTAIFWVTNACASHLPTHVLILNSYHQSFVWEQNMFRAFQDVLEFDQYNIEIHVENMDTKRVPYSEQYKQQLLELYRKKYADTLLALIIATDDNAFNFMREFRDTLFPGVPVVFCGVNFYDDRLIAGLEGFTGIAEDFDAAATVSIALKIHPQTRKVFVINDYLPTGLAWTSTIKQELADFSDRLDIHYAENLSMEELQAQLQDLSADTIVLLGVYFRDRLDHYFRGQDSIGMISAVSPVPVYGLLNYHLGHGMVGGNLISGYYQGKAAARLANRILAGESPGDIAVVKQGANRNMFDLNQLERWGIDPSTLPPDSIIINKPSSFYAEYKGLVWSVAVFVSGLVAAVVILTINIRRRKKAEQQLLQAQEALEQQVQQRTAQLHAAKELAEETARQLELQTKEAETLFNNSPVAILYMDDQRVIKRVNPEIIRITGYEEDELIGKTSEKFFASKEEYESFGKEVYPLLRQGGSFETDHLFKKKNGTSSWCLTRGRLINKDDISQGVIWIIKDIDERVKAEEEKLLLAHHLEEVQRFKSLNVMAGAFTHHFNNIMMAVLGNLQLLELQHTADSKIRHMVDQAIKASRKASTISEAMLAYLGQQELHMHPNDLAAMVSNMEDVFRSNITPQIELVINCDAESVWSNMDMRQIEEVILNLVLNASEAIGDVDGQISITIGYAFEEFENLPAPFREDNLVKGRYAFCQITDNGCGMDELTINQMFDPFFTTRFTGRGLGLPVAAGIVRAHHGALTVSSSLGQGTTIRLLLPALDMADEELAEQRRSPVAKLPSFSGIVLLADDDVMVGNTGRLMLEEIGFDVLFAEDGQEAVEIYNRNQEIIDLVILDVAMPHMDGIEALQEMRRINAQVKVILTSGYTEDHVKIAEREEQPDAFMHKPFMLENLAQNISTVLAGKG